MNNPSREKLKRAAIAAKLYKEGVPQTTISLILKRRPAEVNQEILPLARERGYVVTTYDEERVVHDGLDPLEIAACAHDYPNVYALRSKKLSVTVVYSGEGASTTPGDWATRSSADWDQRLKVFGGNAVTELASILRAAQNVGVAWGKTLESVISELRNGLYPPIRKPNGKPRKLSFIPTCGEPSRVPGDQTGSSHLAEQANLFVNGDKYQPYSLKGTPAMLHRSFSHPHREVVRRALRLNPNYAQIFGEPGSKEVPLVNRLDTILTSVASLGQPAKMFGRDLMELAGVSKEDQANILGDLGGAIIPLINADRNIFDDIASLWTGITLDDYRRVGREAHEHSTPGVVVFAIGGTKATLIHHLLSNEGGIISHLIIDHELAMCLDKLLR